MSDFGLLRPGDQLDGIPSRAWNSFLDAAEFVRDARNNQAAGVAGFSLANGICRVKNSSGGDLSRFAIAAPSGILFSQSDNATEFYENPCLTVTTPASADLSRVFCVLQEPIKSGLVGRAMFVGLTVCQIDVIDATDDYVDCIASDSAKLQTQPYGPASILYKESGTGTKWALICMGMPGTQLLVGKTNAAHNVGASGTINVWRGTTAGSESASGTVTAWNHFGNVASGKYVVCGYIQRNWRIIAAQCS